MIQSKVTSSSIHLLSLSHRHNSPISQVSLFQSHKKQGWARPLACTSTKVLSVCNRAEVIKAFDETQAGVRGLLDSGVLKVPNIFIKPQKELTDKSNPSHADFQIPIIDLQGIEDDEGRRREIVEAIKNASEQWGFFQLVNHRVPTSVMEEMIEGVLGFHEQDGEVKKDFYTRDRKRRVRFNSNFDLYHSSAANWRDSITSNMLLPDPIEPQELPAVCSLCQITGLKVWNTKFWLIKLGPEYQWHVSTQILSHQQNFMDLSRSYYQKRILRSIEKLCSKTSSTGTRDGNSALTHFHL